ncbi:MAG: phospholipase D-like domain-containing protein, partial [Caulobacteraceae bacterium]
LRAGETCWRIAPAGRVKFLVDCQDYFAALRRALGRARRSIHLLGWSFDPRAILTPADEVDPSQIGHTLIALAKANPDLDVKLLVWRSALPISATQAFFPHRAKGWFRGTPVRFELDETVPLGACHHQKAVIVDDAVAFVGGADFACDRWDTCEHLDRDPRRVHAGGGRCGPRHEVMAMVDGEAAAALGEVFRARWRAAVGEIADPPAGPAPDVWPTGVKPDLEGARLGVALTAPAWRGKGAVREIAALTLEAIAAAKSLIYLENQYFTWPLAVEALAARLADPEGPEIVLVCTAKSPSYFDRITMDRARSNAIWRLKSSDVFGRFHALAPFAPEGRRIIAHAKVAIFDDWLARVSSANLNNRSHGYDTELELAVEAEAPADRAVVAALRDRLAGHWLGRSGAEVAQMRELSGGLAQALWALDGGHRLRPLRTRRLDLAGEFIADFHIGDPAGRADSWAPWLRRRRLIAESRSLRQALAAPRG